MALTLSITYKLNPPSDISTTLAPTNAFQYPLPDASSDQKAYYDELRAAVLKAKSALGEDLTAWRDAVGKEENKEPKGSKKADEEDQDEEDEDEEEA
ncbi:uncharacterized protein BXZ73DRAFT_54787 [Epithele typhae]|uniref:uncharacterized protein n=1 Tax=Epithele typhae TaxID=378194 RepID=UPI002008C4C1|nr:uncharacterized protein BXZ73DRAFT_54787 [Epithele typhae]KAH9914644.1 hypothetical protein BXZ73DRAFT_54787 [Epithele typhae]